MADLTAKLAREVPQVLQEEQPQAHRCDCLKSIVEEWEALWEGSHEPSWVSGLWTIHLMHPPQCFQVIANPLEFPASPQLFQRAESNSAYTSELRGKDRLGRQ